MAPLQAGAVPPSLRAWLDSEYALAALFAVFVLEGAMLLYFMPSELVVPGALFVLGGSVDTAVAVVGVAVAGATAGQFALFKIAERAGRAYLLERRWLRVGEKRLERFESWFRRWGPAAVPVSNTLLFTRGMLTIPAGLAGMDDRRFLLASAAGTLCFESILAGLYLAAGVVL
ncbi:MAG: DedA family protein [Halobacteriales archaeon]